MCTPAPRAQPEGRGLMEMDGTLGQLVHSIFQGPAHPRDGQDHRLIKKRRSSSSGPTGQSERGIPCLTCETNLQDTSFFEQIC
ncbi:hypothetical protein chiPu_0014833 [Chiloscyllium punctatum]|uniref:Uncharacterized protein n=1 Tax=Chiloscyllium punctatum TaxID=137246 RepID=A0A401T112_CHIPU|nr:hypothetical protein [Chiloscyllium punctatum]